MNYQKIWSKTINSNEKIIHEFSIGGRYLKFNLILWAIPSLLLLFAGGLGIIIFLIAFFYFEFYLKIANAYAFTNKRVLIHTGWLSTKTVSVDYNKITDVTVNEPLFDRIFTKTGHLTINTAGTGEKEVVLKHVASPYELKKKLDERMVS